MLETIITNAFVGKLFGIIFLRTSTIIFTIAARIPIIPNIVPIDTPNTVSLLIMVVILY